MGLPDTDLVGVVPRSGGHWTVRPSTRCGGRADIALAPVQVLTCSSQETRPWLGPRKKKPPDWAAKFLVGDEGCY
jgi:hypothetical protein